MSLTNCVYHFDYNKAWISEFKTLTYSVLDQIQSHALRTVSIRLPPIDELTQSTFIKCFIFIIHPLSIFPTIKRTCQKHHEERSSRSTVKSIPESKLPCGSHRKDHQTWQPIHICSAFKSLVLKERRQKRYSPEDQYFFFCISLWTMQEKCIYKYFPCHLVRYSCRPKFLTGSRLDHLTFSA